jgi:signal transduction histidine kinase
MNAAGSKHVAREASSSGECQALISEAFHELSQPLSTLTCLLEVSLESRSSKQSRRNLQIALQQVGSIVRLFKALRELVEAGNADSEKDRHVLSLNAWVREAVEDLMPVADSAGVKLGMASSAECQVSVEARALRTALYHLLGFALDACAGGADVKIMVGEEGNEAVVGVEISPGRPSPPSPAAGTPELAEWKRHKLEQRLGAAIAGRIFEGEGGGLRIDSEGTQWCIEARLPLASSQGQECRGAV